MQSFAPVPSAPILSPVTPSAKLGESGGAAESTCEG